MSEEIPDDTPILVGVWRGNNYRTILMALDQMGYSTATKIKIQHTRLIIKNLFEGRKVYHLGDQIWLPYVNEPQDERPESSGPQTN